uniref:Fucosyltransferase n=1 Tax=Glossina pallidipes TaxID=7398 RepID=A0A1A9ZI05_GLOPL
MDVILIVLVIMLNSMLSLMLSIFLRREQHQIALENNVKPWFFKNAQYPKSKALHKELKGEGAFRPNSKLFPFQDPHSDRIVNQLMYVPPDYEEIRGSGTLKTILLANSSESLQVQEAGRVVFLLSNCPVDTCAITLLDNYTDIADMILYDDYIPPRINGPSNSRQVTMIYLLENAFTVYFKEPLSVNWTATYRRDSDIVTPYGKWQYYDERVKQIQQDRNYASNKTKSVAWFVSNCFANNHRLEYAEALSKHIEVDIYGDCGPYSCPRETEEACFQMLERDYKFYLAFENGDCKDYVTEKFFVNALNHNILPIAMGARPEDYAAIAPMNSYIHVDQFASPKELANYLHILDKNDSLYNTYFNWKGTGEFINTYFWCRVCALLHDEDALRNPRWYTNFSDWWKGSVELLFSQLIEISARYDSPGGGNKTEEHVKNITD